MRFLLPLPSGHLLCGGSGGCVSLLDPDLSTSEALNIAGLSSDTDFAAAGLLDEGRIAVGAMNGSLMRLQLDIETRPFGRFRSSPHTATCILL